MKRCLLPILFILLIASVALADAIKGENIINACTPEGATLQTIVKILSFKPIGSANCDSSGDPAILLESGGYLLTEDGAHILLE